MLFFKSLSYSLNYLEHFIKEQVTLPHLCLHLKKKKKSFSVTFVFIPSHSEHHRRQIKTVDLLKSHILLVFTVRRELHFLSWYTKLTMQFMCFNKYFKCLIHQNASSSSVYTKYVAKIKIQEETHSKK